MSMELPASHSPKEFLGKARPFDLASCGELVAGFEFLVQESGDLSS